VDPSVQHDHRRNKNRKKVTVTTQNLGPSGIFRVMHVIADTLTMGPQVACFQDILIHGRDIRSVRKAIGDINPDYQVFSDHGSFAPDDFRKQNYAGWGASGLASLTLLNKRAFDIPHCRIHEWRNAKEHKVRLGKGRVLWINTRTLSGKMVNIVNVYQTTANHPEMQKRIYEALTRAINAEHESCILVGDFNASIKDGRANYAPPHPQNFTTIGDEAFADFVGKTNGTLVPPGQEVQEEKSL
jgi:hypothetical protein